MEESLALGHIRPLIEARNKKENIPSRDITSLRMGATTLKTKAIKVKMATKIKKDTTKAKMAIKIKKSSPTKPHMNYPPPTKRPPK